jgi:hypothetical protein
MHSRAAQTFYAADVHNDCIFYLNTGKACTLRPSADAIKRSTHNYDLGAAAEHYHSSYIYSHAHAYTYTYTYPDTGSMQGGCSYATAHARYMCWVFDG